MKPNTGRIVRRGREPGAASTTYGLSPEAGGWLLEDANGLLRGAAGTPFEWHAAGWGTKDLGEVGACSV